MKWIKIKDKLPNKEGDYYCKQDNIHKVICEFKNNKFTRTYITEWLDDSEEEIKPNLLEQLKKYFEITPKEKVLEDWAKSEAFDKISPTMDEFLKDNIKITDTQRLDWLDNKVNDYYGVDILIEFYGLCNEINVREFIDKQIKEVV